MSAKLIAMMLKASRAAFINNLLFEAFAISTSMHIIVHFGSAAALRISMNTALVKMASMKSLNMIFGFLSGFMYTCFVSDFEHKIVIGFGKTQNDTRNEPILGKRFHFGSFGYFYALKAIRCV